MAKKKSTKDILAAARAEAAKKRDEETAEQPESSPSEGGGEKDAAAQQPPAKKKGGTAPTSTKDILAAARAEAAGGGDKDAGKSEKPKPAAKKTAAKKAPAASGGEKPSVQEMLKAAREGKSLKEGEESAKPTPKKPVAAGKIRAAKNKAAQDEQDRRVFLLAWLYSPFVAAWVLFATATGAFLLGLARFMMPNVLVEPPSNFKVGGPGDFPAGTVSTKYKSEFGVWIVNTVYQGSQLIFALRSVCTHLGCTPSWLEGEQKFKCPCHGSGFYIDGINFEGPAPRPLERVGITLAPDGLLEVDKSVTFQQEMGQWEDPASYYEVV